MHTLSGAVNSCSNRAMLNLSAVRQGFQWVGAESNALINACSTLNEPRICFQALKRRLRHAIALLIFAVMRCTTLLAVSLLALSCFDGFAQDSPTAAAEREEARERQQRMSAKIEELEAA